MKASAEEQEQALDKIYQFIMLGDFRKYLDEQEAIQEAQEKELNEVRERIDSYKSRMEGHISNIAWKKSRSHEESTLFTSRSALFWYHLTGTVKASLAQVQAMLEELTLDDWTSKMFTDKTVFQEKSRVVDKRKELEEDWILRFRFPFPYGSRTVEVTRIFQLGKDSYCMFLMPVEGSTAKSTLDFMLKFQRLDSNPKHCSVSLFYALNPDGTFPAALNSMHSKNIMSPCPVALPFLLFIFSSLPFVPLDFSPPYFRSVHQLGDVPLAHDQASGNAVQCCRLKEGVRGKAYCGQTKQVRRSLAHHQSHFEW